jgi:hypothetical protein
VVLSTSVEIKRNDHTLHSKGSQLTAVHVTNCTLLQKEGNEASIFITPNLFFWQWQEETKEKSTIQQTCYLPNEKHDPIYMIGTSHSGLEVVKYSHYV